MSITSQIAIDNACMKGSGERTILQRVIFGKVVQVAGLHACEVVYLAFLSELSFCNCSSLHTRASLMLTIVSRGGLK